MSIANVKGLIEELQKFDPETPVGVGDSFDGGFTPIDSIEFTKNNSSSFDNKTNKWVKQPDWIRLYY